MAMLSPGLAWRLKFLINFFDLSYEKSTFSIFISPLAVFKSIAASESLTSSFKSNTSNILPAEARAAWNWVNTAEISLKGFVYWFA